MTKTKEIMKFIQEDNFTLLNIKNLLQPSYSYKFLVFFLLHHAAATNIETYNILLQFIRRRKTRTKNKMFEVLVKNLTFLEQVSLFKIESTKNCRAEEE